MAYFRNTITATLHRMQFLPLQTAILLLLLSQCQWRLSHSFVIIPSRDIAIVGHSCLQPASIHYCLNRWIRRGCRAISRHDNNDESASSSPPAPPTSLRVGIIGAGSIAFGTASLAATLGHDPMIWSPSGAGTRDLLIDGDDNMISTAEEQVTTTSSCRIQSTGALAHNFNVRIARSSKELVQFSDNVLVVALPVNGHRKVMEELAPEIVELIVEQQYQQQLQQAKDGHVPVMMHVIISSHASLGAVYFMQLLQKERCKYYLLRNGQSQIDSNIECIYNNMDDIGVRITAWGTTAITARKTSGTSVYVLTVRQSVDFCTIPSIIPESAWENEDEMVLQPTTMISSMSRQELLADGYNLCTALFGPRFKHRKGGLLAISLSNLNPQNHLGIVLGNMSRMDQPPSPPPPIGTDFTSNTKPDTAIEPWYQFKNITPNIGRLMEALDRERLDIANALDIDVRTIYEHFSWSFHVPMETPEIENESAERNCEASATTKMRPLTVSEMNQQMHYYLNNDVLGPSSPDSRYVLEDVPYGLVLTVILGRLVECPATLHEAGIRILSAMYGRDFMVENELLQGLGLVEGDIPSLDKWREMAFSGYFRDG